MKAFRYAINIQCLSDLSVNNNVEVLADDYDEAIEKALEIFSDPSDFTVAILMIKPSEDLSPFPSWIKFGIRSDYGSFLRKLSNDSLDYINENKY